MSWRRSLHRLFWLGLALSLLGVLSGYAMSAWVIRVAAPAIVAPDRVQPAQVAIVLGALVQRNSLSPVLEDRVDRAIQLYHDGKVHCLLMSGDHGRADYDEVNAMRLYAQKLGVPEQRIFTDHAGFNTYETMVRARKVFLVESAVVVTNRFHLSRAVFLCQQQGIRTQGVVADRRGYLDAGYYEQREFAARIKAFLFVYLLRPQPTFLGPPIPITGDARLSHDRR